MITDRERKLMESAYVQGFYDGMIDEEGDGDLGVNFSSWLDSGTADGVTVEMVVDKDAGI